ncbi:hypothetical protein BUALT_Bualt01G0186000 [Buddleja alternifolia]|uniref:Uncharacterized protein n=1 Tax=Buddleja alternifolia TaxID=168488 RepID=A0AAV6YIN3_9LAMI|nr:hypothetical protein BUALT_Bualt01G0186000 [Buddleja alternifolia]
MFELFKIPGLSAQLIIRQLLEAYSGIPSSKYIFKRNVCGADSLRLMDKKETCKESCDDATRESLIAISYRLPSADLTAEMSPKNRHGEKAGDPLTRDGDEKYRSELISISYSPSPDAKVLPVLPGQP